MALAGEQGGGLRALSLIIGLFLFMMGVGKVDWLLDSGPLTAQLLEWRGLTSGASRAYLDAVAIPGAPLFARIVPLAEVGAGAAILAGYAVRLVAGLTFAMILHFHFASGILFTAGYLTNGYGLPVLGSLLALAIGGRRLPFSLDR